MADKLNEEEYIRHFFANLNMDSSCGLIPGPGPSRRAERKLGFDMEIDFGKPAIPILIQFKSPNKISKTMKNKMEKDVNLGVSEIDLYMLFLATNNFNQHNAMFTIIRKNRPSLAYYCSPKFYTQQELLSEFMKNNVHLKSAFFCVEEIGSITNNSQMKRICYSINTSNAAIWPIHKTVQMHDFNYITRRAKIKLPSHTKPFWKTIDEMLNSIFKLLRIRLPPTRRHVPKPPSGTKFLQLMTSQPSQSIPQVGIFSSEDGVEYSKKLKLLALFIYGMSNAELFIYQPE